MKNYIITVVCGLLLFTACGSSRTKESTGQYVDSSVITSKVKTSFLKDDLINSFDNDKQKDQAYSLAKNIKGVRDVKNDIEVKE